ncbi:MAG: ATP-binding cassette domain-containing protein, partial [Burkholderiaceae bacterium]
MLKLQRVSASIAGITVLRDIDVSLPPGQLLAVVGRNGAGKTTLLRAIMGLLPISSGRITLDGIDLGGAP